MIQWCTQLTGDTRSIPDIASASPSHGLPECARRASHNTKIAVPAADAAHSSRA